MTKDAPGATGDEARLRILIVSQHYWPESFRINSFAEALIAEGADVTVLTGQPNYPAGRVFRGYHWYKAGLERHASGYTIARVPLIPRGKGGALRLALNYMSFLVAGSVLGPWLLRGRRFDVLFVYGTSPVLQVAIGFAIRRFKKAKVALWVQDLWPHALAATGYVTGKIALGVVQRLVAALYRSSDLILAQSKGFEAEIRPVAGSTPVEYFPNPGDTGSDGKFFPKTTETFDIVFAGNLGRAQALHCVVEAAAILKERADIRILLYGSGAMQSWIEEQVSKRGLGNLILAGRVSSEEMTGVFEKASAALLTLVDDGMVGKTIPSKLQSYLGAGLPVICAGGEEANRIVEEAEAGMTCRPGDPAALAAAILAMREARPDALLSMRKSASSYYIEHFEPRRLAATLLARLKKLAKTGEIHGERTK